VPWPKLAFICRVRIFYLPRRVKLSHEAETALQSRHAQYFIAQLMETRVIYIKKKSENILYCLNLASVIYVIYGIYCFSVAHEEAGAGTQPSSGFHIECCA
jgi:hypothetical protein